MSDVHKKLLALEGDPQQFVAVAFEYDIWITSELEALLDSLRKYESGESLLNMAAVAEFQDALLIVGHLDFLLLKAIEAVGAVVPALKSMTVPKVQKLQTEIQTIICHMNEIYKTASAGF